MKIKFKRPRNEAVFFYNMIDRGKSFYLYFLAKQQASFGH